MVVAKFVFASAVDLVASSDQLIDTEGRPQGSGIDAK
jgi:hypothetical protein